MTSPRHDAQAPVGFSALLMGGKLLARWTTQRPIGLESKVLAREVASASCANPGEAHGMCNEMDNLGESGFGSSSADS